MLRVLDNCTVVDTHCGQQLVLVVVAVQYAAAAAFLRALYACGASGKGIRLIWAGVPNLCDLAPFLDVGWKLLTRTIFKMAAFASVSAVATTLPQEVVASHHVCSASAHRLLVSPCEWSFASTVHCRTLVQYMLRKCGVRFGVCMSSVAHGTQLCLASKAW
jgi:hypothetical protein